jgi:hypothetical protein
MTAAMVGRVGAPLRDGRTRCSNAPRRVLASRSKGEPSAAARANRRFGRIIEIVFPRSHRRHRAGTRRALFALVVVAFLASACAGARFDPSGPCTADGRAPGAYPELERLIPAAFDTAAPTVLDSGRNCSATALGSLASHQVGELRFAGGQWHLGDRSGVTMAVLSSPTGLDAGWVGEFYETSARLAKHTENVSAGTTRIGGVDAFRVETLNDQTSFQTVIVWAGTSAIDVVIVASDVNEVGSRAAHDAIVARAVADFAGFLPG